jgi:monothiol glutaredoxin
MGGCDIVKEMHASGDLAKALGVSAGEVAPPSIALTPAAVKAFEAAAADAAGDVLRLEVSPAFEYGLFFAPAEKGDVVVQASGLSIHLDRASARRADRTRIDFVEGPSGAGFKIENPNEPARVKPITADELKALIDRGEKVELFDVRTESERAIAVIPGARHLDQAGQDYLLALPKDTRVVFHCHHGVRSHSAASARASPTSTTSRAASTPGRRSTRA